MNHWKNSHEVKYKYFLIGPFKWTWCSDIAPLLSRIYILCRHIWTISIQCLAVSPSLFASHLHYSCTYWFVKQPIKLDMEVGITSFESIFWWEQNIACDRRPVFPHHRRGIFIFLSSSVFPKQEPVDTCVTSEMHLCLCQRLELWLCLCHACHQCFSTHACCVTATKKIVCPLFLSPRYCLRFVWPCVKSNRATDWHLILDSPHWDKWSAKQRAVCPLVLQAVAHLFRIFRASRSPLFSHRLLAPDQPSVN